MFGFAPNQRPQLMWLIGFGAVVSAVYLLYAVVKARLDKRRRRRKNEEERQEEWKRLREGWKKDYHCIREALSELPHLADLLKILGSALNYTLLSWPEVPPDEKWWCVKESMNNIVKAAYLRIREDGHDPSEFYDASS